MNREIRQVCGRPYYRFGIFTGDELHFTISRRIKNSIEKGELDLLDLAAVEKVEKDNLFASMLDYLSRAERSPLQLRQWFERRRVPESWLEEGEALAREQSYLDEGRYAELYLKKCHGRGNRPLWFLKKELAARGIHAALPEYDETTAAQNWLRRRRLEKIADREKAVEKLKSLGYSYDISSDAVKKYYDQIQ